MALSTREDSFLEFLSVYLFVTRLGVFSASPHNYFVLLFAIEVKRTTNDRAGVPMSCWFISAVLALSLCPRKRRHLLLIASIEMSFGFSPNVQRNALLFSRVSPKRPPVYIVSSINSLGKTRRAAGTFLSQLSGQPFSTNNDAIRQAKQEELKAATKMSLAPMMEYTDRHFRHMVRLVSNRTLLYTEMVAANALSHERRSRQQEYMEQNPTATPEQLGANYDDVNLLRHLSQGKVQPLEGPSVLQLGGSDPKQLIEAAQTVMELTTRGGICEYTAINLNCGCPSPKVAGKGCFGAALMDDPKLVAQLTRALHDGTEGQLPVTVKCRIGTDSQYENGFSKLAYSEIDEQKEYSQLCRFIETVASDGIVTDFQVHARIAVLQKSFSPADNRKVPPVKYDFVRRLAREYPEFTFSLNGGIESLSQAKEQFEAEPNLAGVMIGRSWAAQPWSFAMTDRILYDTNDKDLPTSLPKNRLELLQKYGEHADAEERNGDPVKIRRFITKAVVPLFAGEPNGKRYRIALDQIAGLPKKLKAQGKPLSDQIPLSEQLVNAAMETLSEEVLLQSPEESYERILWEEAKRRGNGGDHNERSGVVRDWQTQRKQEEALLEEDTTDISSSSLEDSRSASVL